MLANEAVQKVANLNFTDEIEVHLGYLVGLTAKYPFPVQISTMLYPRCSGVTEQDWAAAEKKLSSDGVTPEEKAANDAAYQNFLASSPLMRSLLARMCPTDMTAADARASSLIDLEQKRIYREMDEIVSDTEGSRALSNRLMVEYRALENTILAKVTLPVLQSFLQQRNIDASL